MSINPLVLNGIAVIVTVVWALTAIADVIVQDYSAPGGIHLVAGSVVGGIFGIQVARRR